MGDDFTKRTQDTLGKIIKKPPLTTKLLSKPPFRFLHDVFTEVIKTTGFLNGLFTPSEMDSKNVSVKEDKMAFLQKVIDVVSIVSGEQLSARPSKIVAGHDPEKTNELLQAVAKCINKNISSDDAVQQVISGKKSSKVSEKPPAGSSKKREGKENREKPDESRKKRKDKDEEKHEREKSSDRRKRSEGKDKREKSKDKESSREQGAGEGSEESHRSRDKSRDKERNKEEHSRDRREKKERKESKTKMKSEDASRTKKSLERKSSTKTLQKSSSKDKRQSISKSGQNTRNERTEKRRKKSTSRREEEAEQEDEDSEVRGKRRDDNDEEERPTENQDDEGQDERNEKPASSRPPRPASAKGHRRRQAPDRGGHGSAVGNEESSSNDVNRSRPARPPSARPAAPRVRQKQNPAEEEIERMESAGRQRTAPIIADDEDRQPGEGISFSDDDEDDQFLVQDEDDNDIMQPPEMEKLSPMLNGNAGEVEEEETGEHGGLVKKILETKKELETLAAKGSNAKKRTEIERAPVNEVQRRKERELVMREIEKLRASVQKLCRSADFLGKNIDYIQEDMDSMQTELMRWKKENKEHAARLKEEESITVKTIEPMQAELDELDRNIAYQLDMIAASKCNVIRNQEKIDKMVAGVTARS